LLRHIAEDVLKWAKVNVFQMLILIVLPILQSRKNWKWCEALRHIYGFAGGAGQKMLK